MIQPFSTSASFIDPFTSSDSSQDGQTKMCSSVLVISVEYYVFLR